MSNYTVWITGWSGTKVVDCETPEEVWEVLGNGDFGQLYEVWSSTGEDVSEFIPF